MISPEIINLDFVFEDAQGKKRTIPCQRATERWLDTQKITLDSSTYAMIKKSNHCDVDGTLSFKVQFKETVPATNAQKNRASAIIVGYFITCCCVFAGIIFAPVVTLGAFAFYLPLIWYLLGTIVLVIIGGTILSKVDAAKFILIAVPVAALFVIFPFWFSTNVMSELGGLTILNQLLSLETIRPDQSFREIGELVINQTKPMIATLIGLVPALSAIALLFGNKAFSDAISKFAKE